MILRRTLLSAAMMARVVLANGNFALSHSWKRSVAASSLVRPMATSWSSVRSLYTSGKSNKDADHDSSHHSAKLPEDPKTVPNEEWAKRLDSEEYFCAREGGTEPPFSGKYVHHKGEGIYNCVCCGTELFNSKTKYDSKSGWPSFHSANEETVVRRKDLSHGMVRVEILCKNCNAHLGHVFEDGPQPTGERFCVNSASLKFQPKKLH